ncbi:glucose-1-phosphate thymidylyltransferase [Helicobacter jaachi]|uniref:Glucose-1-phosphate thymidylyltransferase n=1 Tax=Helicobacter jaachi TaxID=1677920 RepID=A0A4U8T974_9HELI|nr:glucose-1-phosphate thymidylyltransferase RfbA [Helicobacter jaachi]TLD96183.1 glucose-1-phosphate thymidylyltransferase [Helicobacter jaachi]
MKGIILAGGSGTRLYPLTKSIVKQLLPIYDKPMIYYPLSILMLASIREILIISTPKDLARFQDIFKDGSHLGLSISYAIQEQPNGLAESFIIGREFVGKDDVCLVLGDNLIYGEGLVQILNKSVKIVQKSRNAVVFGYYVSNPKDYGVIEFNDKMQAISLEEKPAYPKSHYAVIGLYFYPNDVLQKAALIRPSMRGELEITSINELYLQDAKLSVEILGRGYAWLDTGTHEHLLEAGKFIEIIEKRVGLKIACIEEIAYKMGFISKEQLRALGESMAKNQYGQYLLKVAAL